MAEHPAKRRRFENGNGFHDDHASFPDSKHGEVGREKTTTHRERRSRISVARDNLNLNGAFAGEVYKSNMFKIQVDELLEQVRPNFSRVEQNISSQLRRVKDAIEAIPDREPITVCASFAIFDVR
jgi:U3 small nucleolar RNA-associated protein 22